MQTPKQEVTLSNLSEAEKDFRDLAKDSQLLTDEEFNSRKISPSEIQLKDAIQMSQLMCRAKSMLPAHLHGNPGECLAMILLARDWGMSPYTVGQHSYIPSGSNRIGFDGQLINAVINNSRRLCKPLRYEYEGEGKKRTCTAYGLLYWYDFEDGKLRKEDEERAVTVTMPQEIQKQGRNGTYVVDKANSTLWDSDPDQQLAYKAARWWCRKYIPEVLFGVYSSDEIMEMGSQHRPERNATESPASNINTIIAEHNKEKGRHEDISQDIQDAEEVNSDDQEEQQPEGAGDAQAPQEETQEQPESAEAQGGDDLFASGECEPCHGKLKISGQGNSTGVEATPFATGQRP